MSESIIKIGNTISKLVHFLNRNSIPKSKILKLPDADKINMNLLTTINIILMIGALIALIISII